MTHRRVVLLLCLVTVMLLCAIMSTEARQKKVRKSRYIQRVKRSVSDRGLCDYLKVFSAYLGEIPMTHEIRRIEMNLSTDRKLKITNLKKSQRFARWNSGRGNKQFYQCPKNEELNPVAFTYVHSEEKVSSVDTKVMADKGFILTETERKGKFENQKKDAMEIKFAKPVYIRSMHFPGKHNLIQIGIEWRDGSRWREIQNTDGQLEWFILRTDSTVPVFIPRTDKVRIFPQRYAGDKPMMFGLKFLGCS